MLARHQDVLRPIELFSIKSVAGSWAEADWKFFASGGVFDQITAATSR